MKLRKWPISLVAMALLLGACSNNHKKSETHSSDSHYGTDADFLVDGDGDLFFDDHFSFDTDEDIAYSDSEAPLIFDDHEMDSAVSHDHAAGAMELSSEFESYTFKEGDTLMWVAFNIYGDYRKWKELKEWNSHLATNQFSAGSVIRYKAPTEDFVWRPAGLPHLVKRGETLGSISTDKYGTMRRWKDIYHNNQPLIRDPNLIFAGFTLYYVPDDSQDRGLATQY